MTRILNDTCFTFRVPSFITADGRGYFTTAVMEYLCRWLKVPIEFSRADYAGDQGSIERARTWMQDVLSEICKTWPTRCDDYVAPACWIKRTIPDPSFPFTMTPFQLICRRSLRTKLDTFVPQMDGTETPVDLTNVIGNRRHNTRVVADTTKMIY